jgi:hypothetical protein
MPCASGSVIIYYSPEGEQTGEFEIVCSEECDGDGNYCKPVYYDDPSGDTLVYCACRHVTEGKYEKGAGPPPFSELCHVVLKISRLSDDHSHLSAECNGSCPEGRSCEVVYYGESGTVLDPDKPTARVRTGKEYRCECKPAPIFEGPGADKLKAAWKQIKNQWEFVDSLSFDEEPGSQLIAERNNLKLVLDALVGWKIKFEPRPSGVGGDTDCAHKTIRIAPDMTDPCCLAAVLGHEAIHAHYCPTPDSIQQEYEAYKKLAEIWENCTMFDLFPGAGLCADWSRIVHQGEEEAKKAIRENPHYRGLPER